MIKKVLVSSEIIGFVLVLIGLIGQESQSETSLAGGITLYRLGVMLNVAPVFVGAVLVLVWKLRSRDREAA